MCINIIYIQFNFTEYVTDHFKHVSRPVLVTAINDKCAQARAKKEGRKYGKYAAHAMTLQQSKQ